MYPLMRNTVFNSMFVLAVILVQGASSEAFACSCGLSAPCQSFSSADVVFIGEVTGSKYPRIEESDDPRTSNESPVGKSATYESGEVYFKVARVFKGTIPGDRVTVHSTRGGGDCGQTFLRGRPYVIFASFEGTPKDPSDSFYEYQLQSLNLKPNSSRLWTGLCSGNVDLDNADSALEYLNNLPKSRDGGTIEGRIFESIHDYTAENLSAKPMKHAKLRAIALGRESSSIEGVSDARGNFRVRVPAGMYKLVVELPEELSASYGERSEDSITVEDTKCAVTHIEVTNNSRIAGNLFDQNGERAHGLSLDLVPVYAFDETVIHSKSWVYVDENEGFTFRGIPPGEYYLCLNCTDNADDDAPYPRWFYPGTSDRSKAMVFKLELGSQFPDTIFKLPPKLDKVSFSGTVLWKDGKPAIGAEVNLIDLESGRDAIFNGLVTDSKGRFSGQWFAGRRYKITVVVWEREPDGSGYGIADAETKEFVLDKQTLSFRILLNTTDPSERSIRRTRVRSN